MYVSLEVFFRRGLNCKGAVTKVTALENVVLRQRLRNIFLRKKEPYKRMKNE